MIIKITKSKSKIVIKKEKKRKNDFNLKHSYNNKKNNDCIIWKPKYSFKKRLKQYLKSENSYINI